MLDVDTLEFPLDRGSLQTLLGICMGSKVLKEAYLLNIASRRYFVDAWRARLAACPDLDSLIALIDRCAHERAELFDFEQAYPQDYKAWVRTAAQREAELEAISAHLRAQGERQWYYDRIENRFTYARYWNAVPYVDQKHSNRFYSFLTPQNVAVVGTV